MYLSLEGQTLIGLAVLIVVAWLVTRANVAAVRLTLSLLQGIDFTVWLHKPPRKSPPRANQQ